MFRNISEACRACQNGQVLSTNADNFERLVPPDLTCPADAINTITFKGRVVCMGPTHEDIDKTSGQDTHLCHAVQVLSYTVRHEDRKEEGGTTDWFTNTVADESQVLPLQGARQEDGSYYVTT